MKPFHLSPFIAGVLLFLLGNISGVIGHRFFDSVSPKGNRPPSASLSVFSDGVSGKEAISQNTEGVTPAPLAVPAPEWLREAMAARGVSAPLTPASFALFVEKVEEGGVRRFESSLGVPIARAVACIPGLSLGEFAADMIRDGINTPDATGRTPLFYASRFGDPQTLATLLENGADLEHTVKGGRGRSVNVLHQAMWSRDHRAVENVQFLLENGMDFGTGDDYFTEMLQNPYYQIHYLPGILDTIDVTAATHSHGITPLTAALSGKIDEAVVKHLLERTEEISPDQELRESPLHAAARWKGMDTGLLVSIIEKGANPNARLIKTAQTPLHFAVFSANRDAVSILLKNGADPNLVDWEGRTALDYINAPRFQRFLSDETRAEIRLLIEEAMEKK